MSSVAGILVGLVLLGYGRRLYWVFVAGVGFLTGLALGPRLLSGSPEWVILAVALALALAGAVLAVVAKKLVIALIGFFAGGGIGLLLLRQEGIMGAVPAWVVYLFAGIVGLVLVRTLFEWALIVLSSLAGARLDRRRRRRPCRPLAGARLPARDRRCIDRHCRAGGLAGTAVASRRPGPGRLSRHFSR